MIEGGGSTYITQYVTLWLREGGTYITLYVTLWLREGGVHI